MKKLFLMLAMALTTVVIYAQNGVSVNVSGAVAHPSAMLDVSASSKGVLITRLTTAQRVAIPNPAPGLLVYDTDRQTIFLFDGADWMAMMFATQDKLPLVQRSSPDTANANFGVAVAIEGDIAVVGAPQAKINGNAQQGAAYVFERVNGSWHQTQRLTASDGAIIDYFGSSVAIYNGLIGIGAHGAASIGGVKCGKVYLFNKSDAAWIETAKLFPNDGAVSDLFGGNIIMGPDLVAVSSLYCKIGDVDNAGAVYIYRKQGGLWIQQTKVNAFTPESTGYFGFDLALEGNTLAVGSFYADVENAPNAGAVYTYIYNGSNWTLGEKIKAPPADRKGSVQFGDGLAMQGDTMIVGAPRFYPGNDAYEYTGRAYEYRRNAAGSWIYYRTIDGDGKIRAEFGDKIQLKNGKMLISAPQYGFEDYPLPVGRLFVYSAGKLQAVVKDEMNFDPLIKFGQYIALDANGRYMVGLPGKEHAGTVEFGVIW